jgi:hypothetical protein
VGRTSILFLLELAKRKDAVYFDCTNTTRVLEVLYEERPKIVLLHEIDKMPRQFQEKLLNFMESVRIKVDQKNLQLDFEIKGAKLFGTAIDLKRLSKPLQSRFRRLHLPKYFKHQFLKVAVKVCPKLSEETALIIGEETWKQQGYIRDVLVGGLQRSGRKESGSEK